MLETTIDEFGNGTLGELARGPGILIIDLGVRDRDLGVGELILERSRVELADDLTLLDPSSFGLEHDDGRCSLDVTEHVLIFRRFELTRLEEGALERGRLDVECDGLIGSRGFDIGFGGKGRRGCPAVDQQARAQDGCAEDEQNRSGF